MARDDAEWRRIVAGAGVEEIAQRAPRSPDEAESALATVADLDRAGRSALRLYAEVLVAASRGQTGRELRNVVRAADRRRGPVADGPSSSARSVGEPVMPTGRRLAQAAVAIVLAMVGPVLLYSRPRRPGWIAPVEDVAVWAGILSVLGALWFTFVEPRRAGRPWLSAGLYMVLAVVTAIGLAILVGRTVMGEALDPVPRGVVFTGLVAAIVVYLVGFVWHRRGERAARDADRAEAAVELDRVDQRLRDTLRARRARVPEDQWPDPVVVLGVVRSLVERGQLDASEAREMLGELR